MRVLVVDGVCRLRCAGHCGECLTNASWRESVGAPDPCGDARGPWRGELFPVRVRKKECGTCAPQVFR